MGNTIQYLNTDLDLESAADLTELSVYFRSRGLWPLGGVQRDVAGWRVTFETAEPHEAPEQNIAAMLDVVESLPEPMRGVWSGCRQRRFDIGYDCGGGP